MKDTGDRYQKIPYEKYYKRDQYEGRKEYAPREREDNQNERKESKDFSPSYQRGVNEDIKPRSYGYSRPEER